MNPVEVAEWMTAELHERNYLYQEVAVTEIAARFGDEAVYLNELGNPAIARSVLREFKKITKSYAVWSRGECCWRFRQDYDAPGRSAE